MSNPVHSVVAPPAPTATRPTTLPDRDRWVTVSRSRVGTPVSFRSSVQLFSRTHSRHAERRSASPFPPERLTTSAMIRSPTRILSSAVPGRTSVDASRRNPPLQRCHSGSGDGRSSPRSARRGKIPAPRGRGTASPLSRTMSPRSSRAANAAAAGQLPSSPSVGGSNGIL